jgi:hypothetical protein
MPYKSKKQEVYLRTNKPKVAKKFDRDIKKKTFKQHKMYKGTMVKTAKTHAEHIRLGKAGYTHTRPKKKKK